jgi:hypothetical protein
MCAQEIKFVSMLLHKIAPNHVERPRILREDNTGAIITAQNQQIGARTKHIDVKYHHVKDMLENGELELCFVCSEHNFADLMTKNVRETIHSALSIPLMDGTMATAFGGCDEEGDKNLVAAGLETGTDLVNPSPATSEWKMVVRRNTKTVKVQNANRDRIVTWADNARSKGGLSGHAKANGNKPKFKGKINSWKSKVGPVKDRRNDHG